MSKTGTPIILDSWLHLLSQLSTEAGVLGRNLVNIRGKHYQPATFMLLKDAGLIRTSFGEHRGYRLRYALTDIPFSVMVNMWSLSSDSYIRRLFLRYGHLSLATVCSLPLTPRRSTPISLDSVCHVIKALRYNEFTCARYFYPTWYTPAYGTIVAKRLKRVGLTTSAPRKGYILLKRQDEISVGDITPIVSNKCRTLSKMLLLAKDVSVAKLFK